MAEAKMGWRDNPQDESTASLLHLFAFAVARMTLDNLSDFQSKVDVALLSNALGKRIDNAVPVKMEPNPAAPEIRPNAPWCPVFSHNHTRRDMVAIEGGMLHCRSCNWSVEELSIALKTPDGWYS